MICGSKIVKLAVNSIKIAYSFYFYRDSLLILQRIPVNLLYDLSIKILQGLSVNSMGIP